MTIKGDAEECICLSCSGNKQRFTWYLENTWSQKTNDDTRVACVANSTPANYLGMDLHVWWLKRFSESDCCFWWIMVSIWVVQIVSSKDLALAPSARWIYALLRSTQVWTFWWKLHDSKFMVGPTLSLSCFRAASSFKFASLLPILGLTEDKFYDPRSTCPARQVSGLRFIMNIMLLTLSVTWDTDPHLCAFSKINGNQFENILPTGCLDHHKYTK